MRVCVLRSQRYRIRFSQKSGQIMFPKKHLSLKGSISGQGMKKHPLSIGVNLGSISGQGMKKRPISISP